jgi:hypothetical protein
MKVPFVLAALLLLPPAAAWAQAPGPQGEHFFIALPDGWVEAARTRQQGADVIAYVPKGQTAESWSDMLTLQVFSGMTALPPRVFYERTTATVTKTCDGPQAGDLQSGLSNGYPSAFWVLGCGRNRLSGRGETSFFRLIQGQTALYMAQRAWRTDDYTDGGPPIPAAESQAAVGLLTSFGVCDPQADGHPCPAFGR